MKATTIFSIFICNFILIACGNSADVGDKSENLDTKMNPTIKNEDSEQTYNEEITTLYSNPETLILQILPKLKGGPEVHANGKKAFRTPAYIYLPSFNVGKYKYTPIPLNDFQEVVSLSEKWITPDSSKKFVLSGIDSLKKVLITCKINGKEKILPLPSSYTVRLLEYLKLDVCHKPDIFKGFDCYAFVSLLANVKYFKQNPEFD